MVGSGGGGTGKLVAEPFLWVDCSAEGIPIEKDPEKVFGALRCVLSVNGREALTIVDTGSGISIISGSFVKKIGGKSLERT